MEQLAFLVVLFVVLIAVSLVALGVAIAKFGLIAIVYFLAVLGAIFVFKAIFG
jgi:hypothetical protein